MKMKKSLQLSLIVSAMFAAALPSSAFAAVTYVGGATNNAYTFNVTLPDYVTGLVTENVGPNASCFYGFIIPVACTSVTIDATTSSVAVNANGLPPLIINYPGADFSQNNTYAGTYFGQPATLTISGRGPAAPAPLLGLGLLPALAAGGGLIGTRRRKRTAV